MTDTKTYLMLDDVNLSVEEAKAALAAAIAGYVNGRFNNWPAIVAKYSKSGKHLLSIDVQGNVSAGAQCLDVEKGDIDPANHALIISWVKGTMAAGRATRDLRWFPKVYTSVSNALAIIEALTAAGIKRDEYMLWTAHYTDKAHICSKACGFGDLQADATQWTDHYEGVSLDASLCFGYFFSGAPAVAPVKPPVAPPVKPPAPPVVVPVKPEPPQPAPPAPPAPPVPVDPPKPVEAPVVDEPKPEPKLAETLFAERVLAAPATLTRPGAADVALPAGTVIYIPQAGA